MKRLLVFAATIFALSSFAGHEWGTALCRAIFLDDSTGNYTDSVQVMNSTMLSSDTALSELQQKQILSFYNHTSFNIYDMSYASIKHMPSGAHYNHVRAMLGETEISAIFVEGCGAPIAFTGDGDCYQMVGQ